MSKTKFSASCPECGKSIILTADIPDSNTTTRIKPNNRGGIDPIGDILVYRISSEQIKNFIIEKSRMYVPETKVTMVPIYCEKKSKYKNSNNNTHNSYASFYIAFSDDIVENKQDLGWFGKIGENEENVKVQSGIMKNLIEKYKYDAKMVDNWLKDYKKLEELEQGFGMTESFINDIRKYVIPQRLKNNDKKEAWIIFSAAPENIISDMLSEVSTGKLPGKLEIKDVYPISKEIIEFVIYVHPSKMKTRENPYLHQLLLGEIKSKK